MSEADNIPKSLPLGAQRNLIAIAVMLSAIMVLLDMTIANVSLPHMMGALAQLLSKSLGF